MLLQLAGCGLPSENTEYITGKSEASGTIVALAFSRSMKQHLRSSRIVFNEFETSAIVMIRDGGMQGNTRGADVACKHGENVAKASGVSPISII